MFKARFFSVKTYLVCDTKIFNFAFGAILNCILIYHSYLKNITMYVSTCVKLGFSVQMIIYYLKNYITKK